MGKLEDELTVFSELKTILPDEPNIDLVGRDLQNLLQVFFLGSLVGLPTLRSILNKFEIKSNYRQVKYKNLCKQLSINKLRKIFEYVFEQQVLFKLKSMCQKDGSCWSKELVTVVLDDSIFRQWLQHTGTENELDPYYGSFFSGQFGRSVPGYKVVALGMSIDGVFYPLYFDFVKKDKEDGSYQKATEVAKKLVDRLGNLIKKVGEAGFAIPKLHLSCDNGYNNLELSQACENNGLIFISVPKKSEKITYDGQTLKLSDWIENHYLSLENEHKQAQEALPNQAKTPFVHRFRATYCWQEREVIFIAFRLNASKKVSVVYTTQINVFAKTLRHHWFNRTYIEQFFKLLKHTLLIQEARTTNKNDFEIKLLRFALVALKAQKLVRYVRKKMKMFGKVNIPQDAFIKVLKSGD